MKELRKKIEAEIMKQQDALSWSIKCRGGIDVTDMVEPINVTIMKQATRVATLKSVLAMIDFS